MVEKIKKNLIAVAIVVAAVVIVGAFLYSNQRRCGERVGNLLPPNQAAQIAIDYINKNLLRKGMTASLANVTEENGLYKFHLKVGGKEFDSYVTRNGKLLFIQGIDLEKAPEAAKQPKQKKLTCKDIQKVEKPKLEAFVVSRCPYGLQMQRVLNEIVKNIPSLADDIRVEYIGKLENGKITSMHGDQEAQENLRQICLREEEGDKYWKYIDCHIKKGEVDSCLTEANVDKGKLNSCLSDSSRGLKYAKEDFDLQNKYKVTGSPTLILNGQKVSEFDFGGRTAQAVKTLLCCGFKTKAEVCSQKLSEDQAATGFSETYKSSSGSPSGGGCK